MTINVKISKKPIEYNKAVSILEKKAYELSRKTNNQELIWILEHNHIYTGGTSFNNKDIIDKSIKIIKTNRGGKITYHGPGQLIFYFVIDLNKRKKDIRWFIQVIEKTIINTLMEFNIKAYSDKKNIGIWIKKGNANKKIGAIGVKIKKWIAFHGFSLNIQTDLKKYSKIKPCGLKSEKMDNLVKIKKKEFKTLRNKLIKHFIKYLVV